MQLIINGDSREVGAPDTVADLLEQLGLDPRTVVVDLNRVIVRRPSVQSTAVHAGDSVEIVHFVGGG
jgi:thiamine biosynthesis protein ThiS